MSYSDHGRQVSTGVQLTWFSPIAPLSFTFAKALKSYPGDDESFFSFDISTGFKLYKLLGVLF